jgi:hypothetical protein
VGALILDHGQETLSDSQPFANTYVASLQLPFPLLFAYPADFSMLIGSWPGVLAPPHPSVPCP